MHFDSGLRSVLQEGLQAWADEIEKGADPMRQARTAEIKRMDFLDIAADGIVSPPGLAPVWDK